MPLLRTARRRRLDRGGATDAALAVGGAPARVVAVREASFAAVPLAAGIVLATGAVVAVTLALAALLDKPIPEVLDVARPALWLGVGGLVLVIVPALAPRRVTAESARRE